MAKLAAARMPHRWGPEAVTGEGSEGDMAGADPGSSGARTGGRRRAGGHYMMEQADSGFRTWQVQAAPQYCRKVW